MNPLEASTIVAVVGAGSMGSGIAQVAAQAGHFVLLYDNRPSAAGAAVEELDRQLEKVQKKGKISPKLREQVISRIRPVESLNELAVAGLVIEAIVENLDVKRHLFAELESICSESCILASNTSSLSITSIAAGLRRPGRFLGVHFFNPAPVMALVEIVSGLATFPEISEALYEVARQWGKTPVHTRSTPGFIVNRVARPFYAESFRLLQEGSTDCATLDALMRDAGGFRMGAFELTDLIGHDVNYAVTCSVFDAYYGDMRFQPSLVQKELVDAGRFGRKSGRGFYDYGPNAPRAVVSEIRSPQVVTNCVVEGDLGVAQGLVARFEAVGIKVERRAGSGLVRIGDAVLAMSDGRTACERAKSDGLKNLVLFDLAHDYSSAKRIAVSFSSGASVHARDQAIGLLQLAGLIPSLLADLPGLIVLRTVAMLANEAADAVLQGVSSAADIDLAMCKGVNYPEGPLAWAERVGLSTMLVVLENLQASYGESRYRPSLLLRRQVAERRHFHDEL